MASLPGMSMSSPASMAATVLWVAPQSEVTKPWKPNWLLRATQKVAVLAGRYPVGVAVGAHDRVHPGVDRAWNAGRYISCTARSLTMSLSR